MELYKRLQSPLTDENIRKILESYAGKYSMYNALTRNYVDSKVKGLYNVEERDAFYQFVFQEWKKSILAMVKNNRVHEKYKKEATMLASYLESINPKTYQEIMDIMYCENISSDPLKKAMETFAWSSIGEFSGWEHIHSNYIYYGLAPVNDIKHRLYINCDSTVLHKFALRLMEKCKKLRTPFYFKFDDYGSRDDTLVVYCNSKNLEKFIVLLNEVKEELQLEKNLHNPPILTSKIGGWIGYGAEPNAKETSFNKLRSEHLERVIKDVSNEWIMRNLNSKFKLNGENTTYREYLLNGIISVLVEKIRSYTGKGENYKKYHGYELQDVLEPEFETIIRREVYRHQAEIISHFNGEKVSIEIPFKAGKITITNSAIENARKKQVLFMTNHSSRFREDIKKQIISTSEDYGIDPDNYAVDTYVARELGKQPKRVVSNIQPEATIQGDASYHVQSNPNSGFIYHAMTEEEIVEARKKLGM